jgi:tetratricopeptide (TPR) repeat protein
MGIFADTAKRVKQENEKFFRPLELTEGNVQAFFNRCLATDKDSIETVLRSILFQKNLGYDEDSKPVFFNKEQVEKNKKNIFYMLGQLKSVHNNDPSLTPTESIYRYDNAQWTTDTVKMMELYHLGETSKGIHPFVKRSNTASINTLLVKPTLSPEDPNFPVWWEEHKAEWEKEETNAKETADSTPTGKELYEKDADAGDANAQYQLGMYYMKEEKTSDAISWFTKAALQGNPMANFTCGVWYGIGGKTENSKAFDYFNKAANFGHNLSKMIVAHMAKKKLLGTEIISFEQAMIQLLQQDVELTYDERAVFREMYVFLSKSLRDEYDAHFHRYASGTKLHSK